MECHDILNYAMSCYAVLCHGQCVQTFCMCLESPVGWMFVSVVMLWYGMLCHDRLCHAMLWRVIICCTVQYYVLRSY